MRWKMNKSMKWSWFTVPVKVEQINEYLFSDTVSVVTVVKIIELLHIYSAYFTTGRVWKKLYWSEERREQQIW